MGLQLRVVNKTKCIRHPAFFFLPVVFPMFSARQQDLPILLEDHHLHLPSIQLLHQSRTTILTLGRLMLGLRRQQRPLLPQGGEGHLQEQVRALQGENLLDTKRGDLQSSHVQELYRSHRDQVQRCFTGKDRVCDTTYDIDTTTKDDYQCCNVETPNCYMEEKTIK